MVMISMIHLPNANRLPYFTDIELDQLLYKASMGMIIIIHSLRPANALHNLVGCELGKWITHPV